MVPSFEAAFTAWLAGIPRRIGSATDRRGALLTEPVAVSSDLHRSDGFAALVAALGWGVAVDERATPLVLTGDDRGYAGRLFRDLGWPDDVRPLFVNPAAAKTPRAWSTARFRELAEVLGRTGRRIIVHGRPPFDAPPDWAASHGVALVSDATLPQMCALLERCALYVGNDSGPAHLASILGCRPSPFSVRRPLAARAHVSLAVCRPWRSPPASSARPAANGSLRNVHRRRHPMVDRRASRRSPSSRWSMQSSARSPLPKSRGLSGFPNAILGPFGVFRG